MTMEAQMEKVAKDAKAAGQIVAGLSTAVKNDLLRRMATALIERTDELLAANELDLAAGREAGLAAAMLDRLALDPSRIRASAHGLG